MPVADRMVAAMKGLIAFVIYLVVLDFAGYWFHRWQHRFGVWWELHAVHHSQQQMSLWSDDRNYLLDDVIKGVFFVALSSVCSRHNSWCSWRSAISCRAFSTSMPG